MGATPRIH